MIKFLKNLIAGILGFIVGLLPGKKKGNGYYLELKEDGTESKPASTRPVAVVATPAPAAKTKKEKAPKAKTTKEQPTKASAPIETTFAPKYLVPGSNGSNGRRYPGANMNMYLDLARQVKIPG